MKTGGKDSRRMSQGELTIQDRTAIVAVEVSTL